MSLLMGIFSGISRSVGRRFPVLILYTAGEETLSESWRKKKNTCQMNTSESEVLFLYYISRYYSIRLFIRLMLKVDVAFHMLFFVPITVLHNPFALLKATGNVCKTLIVQRIRNPKGSL
jgi:hypothetical protein